MAQKVPGAHTGIGGCAHTGLKSAGQSCTASALLLPELVLLRSRISSPQLLRKSENVKSANIFMSFLSAYKPMCLVMGLKEFKDTRQDNSGLTKRWFSASGMDLFCWSDQHGEVRRLEIIWEQSSKKRVWNWSIGESGRFYELDEGDKDPRKNLASMAVDEHEGDYEILLALVETNAGELPYEVLDTLRMLA